MDILKNTLNYLGVYQQKPFLLCNNLERLCNVSSINIFQFIHIIYLKILFFLKTQFITCILICITYNIINTQSRHGFVLSKFVGPTESFWSMINMHMCTVETIAVGISYSCSKTYSIGGIANFSQNFNSYGRENSMYVCVEESVLMS